MKHRLQKRPYRVHLAGESIVVGWQSPLSMQGSSCVYSTQENGQAIKDQIYLSQSLMHV